MIVNAGLFSESETIGACDETSESGSENLTSKSSLPDSSWKIVKRSVIDAVEVEP